MSRVVPCVVLLILASSASAQVFYEPVKYQHEAGGRTYYYGGSDPRVHQYARQPVNSAGTWGRVNGFAFVSGDANVSREVANEPERVFTDSYPMINVHQMGMTPDNARDEAYANVPRYFAKRDVPAMVVRQDNMWVVPAQAVPIRVFKSTGEEITPRPSTMPQPLLIIPKDSIRLPQRSNKQLASND